MTCPLCDYADCDCICIPPGPTRVSSRPPAPKQRIQIVANMSGGVLQGASCNLSGVELYVLDFEDVPMDDESQDRVIEVDGSNAYLSQVVCEHEPDFVQQVVEAPTMAQINEGSGDDEIDVEKS